MTHTLSILNGTGDTSIVWETDDAKQIAVAKAAFDQIVKHSLAYQTDENGQNAEVIREFNPNAPQTIVSPQIIGG